MSVGYSSNGLEQASDSCVADASTEFDSKSGVKRIKLEPHDLTDAEAGVENVTPGLKMLPEVKEEVVEAATTSLPANGADVLPGNDCNSESVCGQPGLKSADRRSPYVARRTRAPITDTRRHRCGLCDYYAKNTSDLKQHIISHMGVNPLYCDVCTMGFHQYQHLVKHRRTHPKETKGSKRTNYCTLCCEQFTSREAFKHHKENHTKKKTYGCNECPERFAYVASLSRHVVIKHSQNFRCDRCGKGFLTSVWHKKHQASCFASVLLITSDESPEQQAPRMNKAQFEEVFAESVSAAVFSTESTTGTQTCLDSPPPREVYVTESVGAAQAYVDSVPIDSWRNLKVKEISPSEEKLSVDVPSEEELSSELEDKGSDDSSWEETFSAYSALDEQPSTDPLALD